MSEKRDIAKDRELCEKATPGPWFVNPRSAYIVSTHPKSHYYGSFVDGRVVHRVANTNFDAFGNSKADAQFIAESRTALPYYISRTEHLERMLEAAIDEIARRAEEVDAFKGPCPNGGWGCAKLGDLRKSKNFNTTDEDEHEFCRKCWSDYLEQKVAAIEVKRRWLKGEATDEELGAARDAVRAAAASAAWNAAWAAQNAKLEEMLLALLEGEKDA